MNFKSPWLLNSEFQTQKEVNLMLISKIETGQGLVEYALILVLVAIVVIVALLVLGPVIGNTFSLINTSLSRV
jgi:pilus assembly protein Flp/PilA